MLGGISTRWKQIAAYYYTGSSTNGSVLKEIILDIINKAENIGLKVTNDISDMHAMNKKNVFNIWYLRIKVLKEAQHCSPFR